MCDLVSLGDDVFVEDAERLRRLFPRYSPGARNLGRLAGEICRPGRRDVQAR